MIFTGEAMEPDWRTESSLNKKVVYKKRFALIPVQCADGKVWLKFYYRKYNLWFDNFTGSELCHTDYDESITEETYMIRKLAETL